MACIIYQDPHPSIFQTPFPFVPSSSTSIPCVDGGRGEREEYIERKEPRDHLAKSMYPMKLLERSQEEDSGEGEKKQ